MTALAFVSLAVWLVLVFGRGGFWRVGPDLLPAAPSSVADAATVLAIVPARDEAAILGETLPTLLAQDGASRFHVLLVDDGSEDGTDAAAWHAAELTGFGERLSVLRAASPPPGWAGKLWALQQGLDWAREQGAAPDLVLFTDADIAHAPGLLRDLLAERARHDAVLVSVMARLNVASAAERWLVPAFVYFFRMLYPFRWVNDPARRTGAAAGGVMLVRRVDLEAAGGLATIRGAIIDDCAMGRLLKRAGPVRLRMSPDAVSVRPYPRFADIRRMVVRSAYAELRYRPERLALALVGLALVFLVPPLAVLASAGAARWAGLAAFALMALSFVPMLRFYGANPLRALALPLIALVYAAFTAESALQYARGRGGAWKGRIQAPRPRRGGEVLR